MNKTFKKKIRVEGISARDVSIADPPTFENITKIAIQYSDGVIIGNKKLAPEAEDVISKTKKPVLPYQPTDNYIDAYYDFYDKILK